MYVAGFLFVWFFKNEKGMVFVLKGLTDDQERAPQSGVVNLRNFQVQALLVLPAGPLPSPLGTRAAECD